MGTHPIFESDFDCLTEIIKMKNLSGRIRLESALDLQRRLPPNRIEAHVSKMIDLAPDLCEDLLERIDQPLKMMRDETVDKDFLLCDYNRDGDSYRSPHSNQYYPTIPDGFMPPGSKSREHDERVSVCVCNLRD